jgi:hypothetical protein
VKGVYSGNWITHTCKALLHFFLLYILVPHSHSTEEILFTDVTMMTQKQ